MPATPRRLEFKAEDFFRPGTKDYYEALRTRLHDEGGDLPSLIEATSDDFPVFPVYSLPNMKALPPPEWLIGEWVERGTMTVVYGPPGSGKTAFLSSLLWAYVAGKAYWFDPRFYFSDSTPVAERRVLYILLEGKGSYPQRFETWQNHEKVTDAQMANMGMVLEHVHFWQAGMQLDKPQDWSVSLKTLYNTIDQFKPQIVVVDTFQMATAGANENSSDVSTVMSILADMQRTFDIATVMVHHPPKDDGNDTPRGHGSITGSAATEVKFVRPSSSNVYGFRWTKTRDVARGSLSPMNFTMRSEEPAFYIETKKQTAEEQLADLAPISTKELAELWEVSYETAKKRWQRAGYKVSEGMVVVDPKKHEATEPEVL